MNRFLTNCLFVSVAAGIVLAVATQATATPVVDQAQLLFNHGIPWPGDVPNGQSFTAGLTGLLTEIDFFSNGPNTGGTATVQVHSGDGLGGPLLGSVRQSFGSTGGDFADRIRRLVAKYPRNGGQRIHLRRLLIHRKSAGRIRQPESLRWR